MEKLLTIMEYVIVIIVAICIAAGLVYLCMLGIDSILPYGEYGLGTVLVLIVSVTIGALFVGSKIFWAVIDWYSDLRDYICDEVEMTK